MSTLKAQLFICLHQLESPLADTGDNIQCKLKLAGPNVLEGVKQCVVSDLISLPVPDILTAMCSSGSNSVHIQLNTTDACEHMDMAEKEPTDKG